MIIAVNFPIILSNWKEEAWKNQGFNGIQTCDLHDTNVMLYQLS